MEVTGFEPVAPTLRTQRHHPSDPAICALTWGFVLNTFHCFASFFSVSRAERAQSRRPPALESTDQRFVERPRRSSSSTRRCLLRCGPHRKHASDRTAWIINRGEAAMASRHPSAGRCAVANRLNSGSPSIPMGSARRSNASSPPSTSLDFVFTTFATLTPHLPSKPASTQGSSQNVWDTARSQ